MRCTTGKSACRFCNITALYKKKMKKHLYLDHRCNLPMNHALRSDESFAPEGACTEEPHARKTDTYLRHAAVRVSIKSHCKTSMLCTANRLSLTDLQGSACYCGWHSCRSHTMAVMYRAFLHNIIQASLLNVCMPAFSCCTCCDKYSTPDRLF